MLKVRIILLYSHFSDNTFHLYIFFNLQNTNQLTPAIEVKALQYMETGYQRELTYRHTDGSFSAFGNTDPSGSTWLVLKIFF